MNRKKIIGLGIVLLLAVTASARDKSGKDGKTTTPPNAVQTESPTSSKFAVELRWGFSNNERQIIQTYVQGRVVEKTRRLPPGLSRKVARGGQLPPGWQSKCLVGSIMPAAVYESSHPLPPDLVVKLPPMPEATLTVIVEGKVVRLLKATLEILDVFDVSVKL